MLLLKSHRPESLTDSHAGNLEGWSLAPVPSLPLSFSYATLYFTA